MPIIIDESKLTRRTNEVRKLLSPISKLVSAQRHGAVPNEFILGALGQNMQNSGVARDWRFKTIKERYYANYTEKWVPIKPNSNEWNLVYAYLTIFNGPITTGKEILALHCDPTEPKSSKYYKYKCGPHVHIHHTDDMIKSAHIALNNSNLEIVVNDILEMNKAFADAIQMIASEFLQ